MFDSFSIQAALDTDLALAEIPVKYSSDTDTLQLYPDDNMMTLLPSSGDGSVTQKYFHLPDYVCAPIQQGDVVGTVELKLAGETIGVVGGTGDGKSTLMQLIPRFYDALSGEVLVGGRNVKDYSLYELRESVSMVLQKNMLFSGTIRDNLRWGNKDATDEQIEHACRLACAHDFVMSFPDGYDTDLGQGGVNVSGGQKQRLCIARALLKNPKILILDDSTSAVDSRTDESIRAAFRESLPGTTKLIIAQRIASIMYSDRIIVMDKGRISDVGTHDELMQRSEIYREVYLSQNKELPQEGGTVSGVNSSSDIKGKEAVTNA